MKKNALFNTCLVLLVFVSCTLVGCSGEKKSPYENTARTFLDEQQEYFNKAMTLWHKTKMLLGDVKEGNVSTVDARRQLLDVSRKLAEIRDEVGASKIPETNKEISAWMEDLRTGYKARFYAWSDLCREYAAYLETGSQETKEKIDSIAEVETSFHDMTTDARLNIMKATGLLKTD